MPSALKAKLNIEGTFTFSQNFQDDRCWYIAAIGVADVLLIDENAKHLAAQLKGVDRTVMVGAFWTGELSWEYDPTGAYRKGTPLNVRVSGSLAFEPVDEEMVPDILGIDDEPIDVLALGWAEDGDAWASEDKQKKAISNQASVEGRLTDVDEVDTDDL